MHSTSAVVVFYYPLLDVFDLTTVSLTAGLSFCQNFQINK